MPERSLHILGFIAFVFLAGACATVSAVSADRIRSEMASIKEDITDNREHIVKLKDKRIGATGYFYIIDTDGSVVFHPQSALIGSSFKNNKFINRIIDEKNGCLANQLGNRIHMVFFEQLNDSEILCLSILSEDLRSPLPSECR